MADKDQEPASGNPEKAPAAPAGLSFSQIQKAAELLKIKRFAQPVAGPAAAPAVPVSAPVSAAATVAPVEPEPDAPTPEPAAAPAPSAAVADATALSMAEPVSMPVPARPVQPTTPAVSSAIVVESQPVPPQAKKDDATVVFPEAQSAAARAEPSLPADYAELKRQALAKAQAQMPQESRLALPVATNLQEYTVQWTLGIGGFGITYLAMDNNLEAEVAIKEYFPSDMCSRESDGKVRIKASEEEDAFKEGLDKFLKECRVLANFKHPNVVRVSRFFQANNTAYMVMDYESGESFRDWLADRKTVEEEKLLKMILPLLDGLEVVHKAGFLHRDIKPANIYVRNDDSMVLLDFGAARHAVGTRSRSLTTIVTPGYAPFEQYHSHGKQGPWTDLYAFAGMLYWVITGSKPIEAPARIKNDGMTPASKAGAGRFSPSFLAAVDWALLPDENKRPQSVAEFKAALTAATPVPVPVHTLAPATPPPAPAVKPMQAPVKGDATRNEGKQGDGKKWWKPW